MNYRDDELASMGIKFGLNISIHRSVLFFNPQRIEIGSNVRIDAHSILSTSADGFIRIGNYVHIAAGCYLFGSYGIEMLDFTGISSRVSIYTATDDFKDGFLTGPTVPDAYRKVHSGVVVLQKHVIVGSGSVILPKVTIGEGAAVGALSLVNRDIAPFNIAVGTPVKTIGTRNKDKLDSLEKTLCSRQ